MRVRRPVGRGLHVLIAAVVVVAGISALFVWSRSTNVGTIEKRAAPGANHDAATKELDGKYISFNYRSIYGLKTLPIGADDLEAYYLNADVNFEKHFSVDVARLNEGIGSYVSYTSRKSHPELYTQQLLNVAGMPAEEFVKTDMTERTVFIVRDNRVAVLAFVSTNTNEDLQTEINTLLSGFEWKE